MKKLTETHVLTIKVTPKSGRSAIVLDKSGFLKCFVKSAAERGLANDELIRLFAQELDLPKSAIAILTGQTSRLKRISITSALSKDEIFERLGIPIDMQQSLNFKGN